MDITAIRAQMLIERGWIHFDNAGASPCPNIVHETLVNHLDLERRIGGYAAKQRAEDQLAAMYSNLASLLGCDATEIAFAENATRAWDMLAYSLPLASGDRILTGNSEYVSNYLAFLQLRKRTGVRVEIVPDDDSGDISLAELRNRIDDDVKLIAITHIATSSGGIAPAAEIGKIANSANIPYLLDACQSVGQVDIDVGAIGCDMLTGAGRKFLRGPRGTGFLYIRRELAERLEPVFVDLGSADWSAVNEYQLKPGAQRFEAWESCIAGRLGLTAAVDYALSLGVGNIERRVRSLANSLRDALVRIEGVSILDAGRNLSGIVAFHCRSVSSFDLKRELEKRGAAISAIATVDARLDLQRRAVPDIARASVHYFNTGDEIRRFADLVAEIFHGA